MVLKTKKIKNKKIDKIIKKQALIIKDKYKGQNILLIGILNGSPVFYNEIFRKLNSEKCFIDFISLKDNDLEFKSFKDKKLSDYNVIVLSDVLKYSNCQSIKKIVEIISKINFPKSIEVLSLIEIKDKFNKFLKFDFKFSSCLKVSKKYNKISGFGIKDIDTGLLYDFNNIYLTKQKQK